MSKGFRDRALCAQGFHNGREPVLEDLQTNSGFISVPFHSYSDSNRWTNAICLRSCPAVGIGVAQSYCLAASGGCFAWSIPNSVPTQLCFSHWLSAAPSYGSVTFVWGPVLSVGSSNGPRTYQTIRAQLEAQHPAPEPSCYIDTKARI